MPIETAPAETVSLGRQLRAATLNCLHDHSLGEVLQHEVRHNAICQELSALDADVIGLNEVTLSLLDRILQETWVREQYTVSCVPGDPRCSHVSTLLGGSFGNLLLSKIQPEFVEYIDQPGDGRQSHVMSFRIRSGHAASLSREHRIAVCSTHLTACPWLMEGRRRRQLAHLTSTLASDTRSPKFDASVVMGDYNFHRELENASIPNGWEEVPAVVALGATWDFGKNAMLAHYLPLHNIYNGMGLGVSFGWPSPMRLDRVLVHGTALCKTTTARLFANQPIHERGRGREPLPQTGRELRESHRTLPWQEYLHPSDHFGIALEFDVAS